MKLFRYFRILFLFLIVFTFIIPPSGSDSSSRRRRYYQQAVIAKKGGAPSEACTTAIYCETFDTKNGGGATLCYAGEGSTCDNTWDDVESTDATNFQAADLEGDGTYSLDLDSEVLDRLVEDGPYNIDTATYAYFQINFDTMAISTSRNLWIGIQATSPHVYIKIDADEKIYVSCGGSDGAKGRVLATATLYHMWLDYVEGSGTGSCTLYVSETSTKPAAESSVTGITDTDNVTSHRIYSQTGEMEFRIDRIIVDDSPIGSNP